MSTFHERLRQLKEDCGETQSRIAEDLGITPQAFSYYMNGREPNYDVLIKISNYFNVSIDYLLGVSPCKKHENIDLHAKLHISDESIEYLKSVVDIEDFAQTFNRLLEDKVFESILAGIDSYMRFDARTNSVVAFDSNMNLFMLRTDEEYEGEVTGFFPATMLENLFIISIENILRDYKEGVGTGYSLFERFKDE